MSIVLNASGSYVNITCLSTVCYEIVASSASSISANWILTFGKFGINKIIYFLAQLLATITGGHLQLNQLVSDHFRRFLRTLGGAVGSFKSHIHNSIARAGGFTVENTRLLRTVVIGPIVEEAVHRLPLLILASKIDALPFASTLISGVLQLTVGQVMKVALAALFSIAFVYGHQRTPLPGRAASLFASGLMYSYLTLKPSGGFINAIVAHSINNFVVGMRQWAASKMRANPSPYLAKAATRRVTGE
jgi:hypothetical protein